MPRPSSAKTRRAPIPDHAAADHVHVHVWTFLERVVRAVTWTLTDDSQESFNFIQWNNSILSHIAQKHCHVVGSDVVVFETPFRADLPMLSPY